MCCQLLAITPFIMTAHDNAVVNEPNEPTLPVLLFGRLRSGLTPEINALATLTMLTAIAIGASLAWLARARPAL